MLTLLLFIAVFGPMAVEGARAQANERIQRARGGVEPADDVYAVMRIAYPAAFLMMVGESAVRGGPSAPVLIAGVVLFVIAKAIKWWAILTLGTFWTFRVIVVPGASLVAAGPYRYVRHPNYIAVVGELVSVGLMAGALITGPIATVGFGLLMLRRIAAEERALGAILPRN